MTRMTYLRLNPSWFMVSGSRNVCLYDKVGGAMIALGAAEAGFIRDALGARTIEEVLQTRPAEERDDAQRFLDQLLQQGMATTYDQPYHVRVWERGLSGSAAMFFEPTRLKVFSLEVTQDCVLECRFCKPPHILGRCGGCGRYGDNVAKLTADRRLELIRQAARLGATELHLTGGDVLLESSTVVLVREALRLGYSRIELTTTGLIVPPSELLDAEQVHFVLQVYSHRGQTHDDVAGRVGAFESLEGFFRVVEESRCGLVPRLVITSAAEDHWRNSLDWCRNAGRASVTVQGLFPMADPAELPGCPSWSPQGPGRDLLSVRRRFLRISPALVNLARTRHLCFNGRLAVAEDGRIMPCPQARAWTMGDAGQEELWEVLFKGRHKRYWHLHRGVFERCRECEYRLGCFDCRVIQGRGRSLSEVSFCEYDPRTGKWGSP